MRGDSGVHQPKVHEVTQANLDFALKGTRPNVNPAEGGGSVNMHWMVLVRNYFADPAGYLQALLDALDAQEARGHLTWGADGCEQGISSPHIELILNAVGTALLDAVRKGTAPLSSRLVRFFNRLYALSLPLLTPRHWVVGPGARMSELGPRSVVLDACVGVLAGRVKRFDQVFRNLYRDTAGPWAMLEALAIDPGLFDEARSWGLGDCIGHAPVLRWPVTVDCREDGHVARLSAPAGDPATGKIGSGGVAVVETRVQYSTEKIAWLSVGGHWFGPLGPDVDLGGPTVSLRFGG